MAHRKSPLRRPRRTAWARLMAVLASITHESAVKTVAARPAEPKQRPQGLSETPEWQRLTRLWDKAVSPETDQMNASSMLRQTANDVTALSNNGMLSTPEAGLLKLELDALTREVSRVASAHASPTESTNPARDSFRRLSGRLPLLEQLAAYGQTRPDVLERALRTVHHDLDVLDDDTALSRLPASMLPSARAVRGATRSKLERIGMRLGCTLPR
jgi:hypothetical protein